MDITKKFLNAINRIQNDKEKEKNINDELEEIKNYKKEIEEKEKEIDEGHKKEISKIKEIRQLIENTDNYKEKLICNDLSNFKSEELRSLKNDLYTTFERNFEIEISNQEKIFDRIKNIENSEKNIMSLEEKRINLINVEIEKAKKGILLELSEYIYDNKQNLKLIDILNKKIKENE